MAYTRTTEETEGLIETMAAYMRLKLAQNSHKPSWREQTTEDLIFGLFGEMREFWTALYAYQGKPNFQGLEEIRREAADVANYMAMLTDKLAHDHKER